MRSLFLSIILFVSFTLTTSNVFAQQKYNPFTQYGSAILSHFENLPFFRDNVITLSNSSHDPTGQNADGSGGHFRYVWNGENVMLDVKGPGVVYRFWTTGYNADDRISLYFDGSSTHYINLTVAEFFSGKYSYLPFPLVVNDNESSGGFVSYVPIPFRHSLKITTTGDSYYNILYHKFEPGTNIKSWSPFQNLDTALQVWKNRGQDPKLNIEYSTIDTSVNLLPGQTKTLFYLQNGPKSIGQILLKVPQLNFGASVQAKQITDNGRAFTGYSEYSVSIDSSADSVELIRRMDYGIADQKSDVYVDGQFAGTWYDQGTNPLDHWRNSKFIIPSNLTIGKDSVRIKIKFVSSQLDWNEFFYWIYSDNVKTDSLDVDNASSESKHHYVISGQTWSGSQTFTYPSNDPNISRNSDILSNLKLKITWDGHDTSEVYAPVGLFFGIGTLNTSKIKSIPVGVTDSNYFYCYFPMPYSKSAKIELENDSKDTLENINTLLRYEDFTGSFDNVGYFHAKYNKEFPTKSGKDYTFLNVEGRGHYVGTILEVPHANGSGYLEGDERFYVDDSRTPCVYGTGTEDYFNGGWYFNRGKFNLATHGLSNQKSSARTMYRFHISDPIVFYKNGKFGIEHGAVDDAITDYQSVAFYYLKKDPGIELTDEFDVGNANSENEHNYIFPPNNAAVEKTYYYEGDSDNVAITDDGSYLSGVSSFVAKI